MRAGINGYSGIAGARFGMRRRLDDHIERQKSHRRRALSALDAVRLATPCAPAEIGARLA